MRSTQRNPRTILPALVAAMLGLVTTFAPTGARAEFFSDGVYPPTGSACYDTSSGELEQRDFGLYGNYLHAPVVVGVFWPGDQPHDPMVRGLFGDFVTDFFESEQWNVVMPQYFTVTSEVDAPPVYLASYDLTLLTVPPGTTDLTDEQIRLELAAQMKAGNLPFTPFRSNPGTRPFTETLYVVHMPPGVTVRIVSPPEEDKVSCVNFAGYHDFGQYDPQEVCKYLYDDQGVPYFQYDCRTLGSPFPFALMPDFSQSACGTGAGYGTRFERYTEVVDHEIVETITDPFFTGWRNTCTAQGLFGQEMSDVCDYPYNLDVAPPKHFYAPRRTYSAGAPQCPNRWARTAVYSNADSGCVVTGSTTDDTPCVETCDGCDIDGVGCVPTETVDSTNPCAICDPARSASAWSPRVPTGSGAQVVCRSAQQACELDAFCPAGGIACPAENPIVTDTTHVCRSAVGVCDVAETCDGASRSCPNDAKSTAVCRAPAGACDVAETCDGVSDACPADEFRPHGAECRASEGVCDVAESCTGGSAACPADAFASDTTTCTGSSQGGACDAPDHCSGTANTCVDAFQPATVTCRTATGQCDVAESCTGAAGACPADALAASGASCDDGNQCTGPDTCNGGGSCLAGPPVYGFEGFFSPVDNPNVVNTGKAGRAFALKWKLPLCAGGYVDSLTAVTGLNYRTIACDNSLPQDPVATDAAASGSSGLHYDSATNQYVYAWQTASSFANKCYEFRVTFDNGTSRTALFKFTK